MTRIVWAPQALEDVQAIRNYLSRDSADYADLVVERIVGAVSRLEIHPRSGRMVTDALVRAAKQPTLVLDSLKALSPF